LIYRQDYRHHHYPSRLHNQDHRPSYKYIVKPQ
jgi:hypothetical protein